MNITRAI